MPWGSPIGSGRGLNDIYSLRTYYSRFHTDATLIIDAGIGKPSDAAQAMELGYDGVLLNTAIAKADQPVAMARAFALATVAGRSAFDSGTIESRDTVQLRIKDSDETQLRNEIRLAKSLCGEYNCQLIINDYWQLALEEDCDYIHLGQ